MHAASSFETCRRLIGNKRCIEEDHKVCILIHKVGFEGRCGWFVYINWTSSASSMAQQKTHWLHACRRLWSSWWLLRPRANVRVAFNLELLKLIKIIKIIVHGPLEHRVLKWSISQTRNSLDPIDVGTAMHHTSYCNLSSQNFPGDWNQWAQKMFSLYIPKFMSSPPTVNGWRRLEDFHLLFWCRCRCEFWSHLNNYADDIII